MQKYDYYATPFVHFPNTILLFFFQLTLQWVLSPDVCLVDLFYIIIGLNWLIVTSQKDELFRSLMAQNIAKSTVSFVSLKD